MRRSYRRACTATAADPYVLDNVFDASSTTLDVYEHTTRSIIQSVVGGFNGTVFAYGQTSSGKTHTMQGTATEPGIIPLAVREVFDRIETSEGREFLVRVSYLEIYNETMVDLFSAEPAPAAKPQMGSSGGRDLFGSSGSSSGSNAAVAKSRLQIKEDPERGVYVSGLKEEIVTSPEQVLSLMEQGVARRHVGETNMNAASSRSHTIFRMVVESREVGATEGATDAVLVATLNLVDLAGSERVVKTGAEGVRMKEGAHINKSLMNLGIVINKLAEGTEKSGGHIPFRDSKLTRILQPALGGNSKTAIVCNITPSSSHAEETHSTLRFAMRAKRVTNNATVNEVMSESALIKRQQREIEELRKRLGGGGASDEEINALRREMLAADMERERLANELELQRAEKERAEKEASQKIDNLTKLVLKSSTLNDEEASNAEGRQKRGSRRETWCPNNRGVGPDFLKGRQKKPSMESFAENTARVEVTPDQNAADAKAAANARAARRRGGFLPPPPCPDEIILEEGEEEEGSALSDGGGRRSSGASVSGSGDAESLGRRSGSFESVALLGTPSSSDDHVDDAHAYARPRPSGISSDDHAAAVAAAVAAVRANMEEAAAETLAASEAANAGKLAALERQLAEAHSRIDELVMEKTYMERDIERLELDAREAMRHSRDELESARSEAAAERERAKELLAAARARAYDAEAARGAAQAEAAAMVEANKLAEARNAQLRAEVSAAADAAVAGRSEAAREARQRAELEVEEARAAAEAQAEAAAAAELAAKIADLEERLEETRRARAEAETCAAENAKAASECSQAKVEATRLTKELKAALAAPKQLQRETESLRKDLEKARDKATQFEGKFRAALQERAAAASEKGVAEKELKRLKGQAEAANKAEEKKGKAVEQRVERLTAALEEKQTALTASKSELKKLTAALAEAEKNLIAAKRETEESTRASEARVSEMEMSLRSDASNGELELASLRSERDAAVREANAARERCVALEAAAEATAAAVDRSRAETEALLEAERGNAREELERQRAQAEEAMTLARAAAEADIAAADARTAAIEGTLSARLAESERERVALERTVRESEEVLEEAVGRAEEEAGERAKLEKQLAAMNNAASAANANNRGQGSNGANAAALAEMTTLNAQLERRAIRAEDRLQATQRELAAARSSSDGAALSAPQTPQTSVGGASDVVETAKDTAALSDENKQLRKELRDRKLHMHKMQEVYGRLRDKFTSAGGKPEAFDTARDVSGMQYELQFTETKRQAERKRAEGLATELARAKRELEALRKAGGVGRASGGPLTDVPPNTLTNNSIN